MPHPYSLEDTKHYTLQLWRWYGLLGIENVLQSKISAADDDHHHHNDDDDPDDVDDDNNDDVADDDNNDFYTNVNIPKDNYKLIDITYNLNQQ